MAAAGLPLTAALALDGAGVIVLRDPWAIAVPSSAALLYAAVGRATSQAPARFLAVAAWAGFVLSLLAVVLAVEPVARAVSLTALILTTSLTPSRRRARIMVWAAWLAIAGRGRLVDRRARGGDDGTELGCARAGCRAGSATKDLGLGGCGCCGLARCHRGRDLDGRAGYALCRCGSDADRDDAGPLPADVAASCIQFSVEVLRPMEVAFSGTALNACGFSSEWTPEMAETFAEGFGG